MVSLPEVHIDFSQDRNRPKNRTKTNSKRSTAQEAATDATHESRQSNHKIESLPTLRSPGKNTPTDLTVESREEISADSVAANSSPQADISPVRATKAAPLYSRNPAPDYPPSALRYGWEGEVWLKVVVSSTGAVETISIEQSSDYRILDQAAINTVQNWQFKPAKIGSAPTKGSIRIPIRFTIKRS